ncbi:MAG TPA: PaaX family transcriptional regulator C-terminal domain-containing protein [Pseudonocardiaceae bacterium]|nr:PaaX family transcriptional regulator C-terminal domain-containing protein [Pseudonocardiaceae bacterium]
MATESDDIGARGQKPRALIITLYGLYARETGGWMSVSSIVRLLAECGVDEPSARSSIHRLKRRGLLTAEKIGGAAGYALSDEAQRILAAGDGRIFVRPHAEAGEGWLLAAFSVPESERDKRHQLRSRLSWLGFGTVSAGVWIAPAHLFDETYETLRRHGLDVYVELFRGDHLAFADTAARVADWWDLPRLQGLYQGFLDRHGPMSARYRRRTKIDESRAFADYLTALTDWRQLCYADPGLPVKALPSDWNGVAAATTFADLRTRLAGPAHRLVDSVRAG